MGCPVRGLARGALGECGQVAGLPEFDEVLEPGEQAHQAGDDQSFQWRGQPSALPAWRGGGAQACDLFGQGGLMRCHCPRSN